MKLYPPIFPGDSILQPGTLPGGDAESTTAQAAFAAPFVRSNIGAGRAPESRIDLVSIEERARAERNAYIAGRLKSLYAALTRGFGRATQARREHPLGTSHQVCAR